MPSFRYRIELKVEDGTGLATFILFDSTAEKLLHISANELINKCSQVGIWNSPIVLNIFFSIIELTVYDLLFLQGIWRVWPAYANSKPYWENICLPIGTQWL